MHIRRSRRKTAGENHLGFDKRRRHVQTVPPVQERPRSSLEAPQFYVIERRKLLSTGGKNELASARRDKTIQEICQKAFSPGTKRAKREEN